ncbi:MAG: hypothetical protein HQ477_07435, partial [Chloroflexi bacterium]|nr:hypothetical protein [Chloroflexota bacterium]
MSRTAIDIADLLPDIKINIRRDKVEFFRDLHHAGETLFGYTIITHKFGNGGSDQGFAISAPFDGIHVDASGHVNSISAISKSAMIEVSATSWRSEPITYEEYVNLARWIFKPLLKSYNALAGSKMRLIIESKAATEPQLPKMAQLHFDPFVFNANRGGLQQFDWDRFYNFIYVCHRTRVKLQGSSISRLLIKSGFEKEYADDLGAIYGHGRKILKQGLRYPYTLLPENRPE